MVLRGLQLKLLKSLISCKGHHRYCSSVRVRFAPSPTGQLHIGGYRTALYNYLFAKKHNGTFILRLEDTDQERLVPGAALQMEQILEWGYIAAQESPLKGGPYGPYTQSQRLNIYKEAVDTLLDKGHAYKCFCSERRLDLLRREAARQKTSNKYDGRCRGLSPQQVQERQEQGEAYVIRFKLDPTNKGIIDDLVFGVVQHNAYELEGDPIVLKSDGFPTYHLANVVDDHYMEISHVFRGFEWQASTPKHIMLYNAFNWRPPLFGHLPLILNPDGTKLSKRQGDVHMEHFKDSGYLPESLLNFVTISGGGFGDLHSRQQDSTDQQLLTVPELANAFEIFSLRTNSSQMNFDRLDQFNRVGLREKMRTGASSQAQILRDARVLLENHYGDDILNVSDEAIIGCIRWGAADERITKLSDLVTHPDVAFLWARPKQLDGYDKSVKTELLDRCCEVLSVHTNFAAANKELRKLAKVEKIAYPTLMKCLRICLCGRSDGPPIKEMIEQLGLSEALERIRESSNKLAN
jgi:glutamyl-tRNA synthetase